ncbi:hypothetical protein PUN28_003202 [Cardiocondyla obscurior]|uniref:Uncharacterized protein n=1 Tax=Cardiocondyla obscurior TaxID=286306 RepID=A0AAW2GM86_9HYME
MRLVFCRFRHHWQTDKFQPNIRKVETTASGKQTGGTGGARKGGVRGRMYTGARGVKKTGWVNPPEPEVPRRQRIRRKQARSRGIVNKTSAGSNFSKPQQSQRRGRRSGRISPMETYRGRRFQVVTLLRGIFFIVIVPSACDLHTAILRS